MGTIKKILNKIEEILIVKYKWQLIPDSDVQYLYIDVQKYKGEEKKLNDGTSISAGDIVGEIHVNNNNMPEVSLKNMKWFDQQVHQELTYLAKSVESEVFKGCKAFYGRTILYPFARRYGFEVILIDDKLKGKFVKMWDHFLYNVYTNRKKSRVRTSKEVWISRGDLKRIEEMSSKI